jgi:phospholipid/cholesterol/gamma-HCH transport system substrate-binding protein
MQRNWIEIITGAIVVSGAIIFLIFAMQYNSYANLGESYKLNASFVSASGINRGADVTMSGVKIGSVTDLTLDKDTYQANVIVSIDSYIKVPKDSSIKIAQDGLLGGGHIAITPGIESEYLAQNDSFEYTQDNISLIDLISRAVFSAANGSNDSKKDDEK